MTGPKPDAPTSALHRTDVLSLIFGLLFLGVAGWWAASYYLDWVITWHLPDVGWLLAGGLILLGVIGILASLRRDRRDPAAATPPGTPAGPPAGPVETVRDAGPPTPGFAEMATEPPTVRSGEPDPAGDPTTELDPRAGEASTDPGEVGGHRPRDI